MKMFMIDQARLSNRRLSTATRQLEDLICVVLVVAAIVAVLATVVDVISIPDSGQQSIYNLQHVQD